MEKLFPELFRSAVGTIFGYMLHLFWFGLPFPTKIYTSNIDRNPLKPVQLGVCVIAATVVTSLLCVSRK